MSKDSNAVLMTSVNRRRAVDGKTGHGAYSGMLILAGTFALCASVILAVYAGTSHDVDPHPGMIWISGGDFEMGSNEPMFRDAQPVHRVHVDGFWMDETEVTNKQYAEFVQATGYITVAERVPRIEDYPGAPPENLFAGSVVFTPPGRKVSLDNHFQWWRYVKDADWRRPEGRNSSIRSRMDHPVVHIAYEDAEAYGRWSNKRLPTEAEWEYAARGGLRGKKFVWGDASPSQDDANIFQGHFPDRNTAADGYVSTSPVKTFSPNGYGLYGMAGNVWEWTADWYRPDTYRRRSTEGNAVRNPRGPGAQESFDPSEPGVAKRVQKGGSFLCTDQYCARYMPGGRGKGAPDTGTNHVGFRLVKDP